MIQSSPTDDTTGHGEQAFVHVRPAFVPQAESSELMQQSLSLLNHVTVNAQAASVIRVSPCQKREDLSSSKGLSMRLRVISAVTQYTFRAISGVTGLPGDRRNGIDEGNQLRDIVPVGPGQLYGQRHAAGIR